MGFFSSHVPVPAPNLAERIGPAGARLYFDNVGGPMPTPGRDRRAERRRKGEWRNSCSLPHLLRLPMSPPFWKLSRRGVWEVRESWPTKVVTLGSCQESLLGLFLSRTPPTLPGEGGGLSSPARSWDPTGSLLPALPPSSSPKKIRPCS